MPIHYDEFLNCARQFLQQAGAEIDLRNCSSRAYYYLFHKVRETFRHHKEAHFHNGMGDHEEALKFLLRIDQRPLADRFLGCLRRRENADYDINDPFSQTKAQDQLSEVEAVAREIDNVRITQP